MAHSDRKTAIAVGILFLIATGFLYIGEAVYGPFLGGADYLGRAFPNKSVAVFGMLLEFVCVIAIPLISVLLFPILRRRHEALAIGYVGFRFFEAVLFVNVEIRKLSLINVSEGYLAASGTGAQFYRNLGSSIQATNDWMFSIYVIVFGVGAIVLYTALFRSRFVPRFISVWGFLAAILIIAGAVLAMVLLGSRASGFAWAPLFFIPIAVNEMVLAVWLIAKGFHSTVPAAELSVR